MASAYKRWKGSAYSEQIPWLCLTLVVAGLGVVTMQALAGISAPQDGHNARLETFGEVLVTKKEIAILPKEMWVGGVFTGRRRANNVPEKKSQNNRVFYGMQRLGFGEQLKSPKILDVKNTRRPRLQSKNGVFHIHPEKNYRTVCVRLCDGHYFPISESSRGRDLAKDHAVCQSRCRVPAELYIAPAHQDPQSRQTQLTALDGVPYMVLKTAYLYRSRFVSQCSCLAPLNTPEAEQRHAGYRAKEKEDGMKTHIAVSIEPRISTSNDLSDEIAQTLRSSQQWVVGGGRLIQVSSQEPRRRPRPRIQPRW